MHGENMELEMSVKCYGVLSGKMDVRPSQQHCLHVRCFLRWMYKAKRWFHFFSFQ